MHKGTGQKRCIIGIVALDGERAARDCAMIVRNRPIRYSVCMTFP